MNVSHRKLAKFEKHKFLGLFKAFYCYLKARLLGELISFGVGEVVVREGGIQRGNQMEQSFPAHINSGMTTSPGRRH
jgi:hypothetical protein